MSDQDINRAKNESKASNDQLEHALDQLKDAVDSKAKDFGEKRERINHLFEDKRRAAQDIIGDSVKNAENFLDEKTEALKEALFSAKNQTDQFLEDVEGSFDDFVKNTRASLLNLLELTEDRRLISMGALFLAGFIAGGLLNRRLMARRTGAVNWTPGHAENASKIA